MHLLLSELCCTRELSGANSHRTRVSQMKTLHMFYIIIY